MLGKLKIRCDFKDKGCKEVVLLENLTQHTIKCKYNVEKLKKKCKKCFVEYPDKSSHDCIRALLELNRKANEEIEALKRRSGPSVTVSPISTTPTRVQSVSSSAQILREESLLREIRELKSEKENFLKTIQELSQSSEQQSKTSKPSIFSVNFRYFSQID